MLQQHPVAPAKAGAQEMPPCPRINPLDSCLRRNNGVARYFVSNRHLTLNCTLSRNHYLHPINLMFERHYLTSLFEPTALAVIGASERAQSPGNMLFKNILKAGYSGQLYPVNPKYETVQGVLAYKSIEEVEERIDLAVIATCSQKVPEIVEQCGRRGVKNVLVTTGGVADAGDAGVALERQTIEIARRYKLRVLGPNCLGIMRPEFRLNASFSRLNANVGHLALVAQSSDMCSTMLDWAKRNRVGFSSVVALGNMADVDFGEILDYLVYDPHTHYILFYIEHIYNARRFMSSLRSAARIKPIILLKAGRPVTSAAQRMHTETPADADRVLDAAVRRAGVVRVKNVGQFFDAAKALAAHSQSQQSPAKPGKSISMYHRHQALLVHTLAPSVRQQRGDIAGVKRLVEAAARAGRKTLSAIEAQTVLDAFGIPLVLTGGANIEAVLRQARQVRPHARVLMVGVVRDPVFGPTIVFGTGGSAADIAGDQAVALPPLNAYWVDELIGATHASRRLGVFRNMPPIHRAALEEVLLNISEMVCELPYLQHLDLNPLIVDEHGAIAAAAHITIGRLPSSANRSRDRYWHMAIPPYPVHLVQERQLSDGQRITLRPIHPDDVAIGERFIDRLSAESRYACFMNTPGETIHAMLVRGTQIDYDGELSLLATVRDETGQEQKIGVTRYVNLDGESVEFSLLVADDWQKRGVGRQLLIQLIECARTHGYRFVVGDVLAQNTKMLLLLAGFGFSVQPHPEEAAVMCVVKPIFSSADDL
jgi:acyl-CoA synthetase (NDP forming)/GNAT superfamily N-acetyltransferase